MLKHAPNEKMYVKSKTETRNFSTRHKESFLIKNFLKILNISLIVGTINISSMKIHINKSVIYQPVSSLLQHKIEGKSNLSNHAEIVSQNDIQPQ